MKKRNKEESLVYRVVLEILGELQEAYNVLQASEKTAKDWQDFGTKVHGIYKSYYNVNAVYAEACLYILQSPAENMLLEIQFSEMVEGNYGFRAAAAKEANIAKKDIKAIKEKVGVATARRYVENLNPCTKFILANQAKTAKELDQLTTKTVATAL